MGVGLNILYWQRVLKVLGGDKEPLAKRHSWVEGFCLARICAGRMRQKDCNIFSHLCLSLNYKIIFCFLRCPDEKYKYLLISSSHMYIEQGFIINLVH